MDHHDKEKAENSDIYDSRRMKVNMPTLKNVLTEKEFMQLFLRPLTSALLKPVLAKVTFVETEDVKSCLT